MNIILTEERAWCWYDWQCWSVSLSALINAFSRLALRTGCLLSVPSSSQLLSLKQEFGVHDSPVLHFLRAKSNMILILVAESGKSQMIDGVRWRVVRQLVSLNFFNNLLPSRCCFSYVSCIITYFHRLKYKSLSIDAASETVIVDRLLSRNSLRWWNRNAKKREKYKKI